jgi:hypothetical protein
MAFLENKWKCFRETLGICLAFADERDIRYLPIPKDSPFQEYWHKGDSLLIDFRALPASAASANSGEKRATISSSRHFDRRFCGSDQ